jgi:hypothetical protein
MGPPDDLMDVDTGMEESKSKGMEVEEEVSDFHEEWL